MNSGIARDLHLLETAAGEWWNSLGLAEKRAYLAAHPASKFAARIAGTSRTAHRQLRQLPQHSRMALDAWNDKSTVQKVASVGSSVVHVGQRLGHHAVHHARHEAHTYAGAARAVAHVARGKKWKDLDPKHKRHLRSALVHAGLTAGSMAMGDATGHSGHAISNLIAHFAHEHAHHAMLLGGGEVGIKTGVDAVRRALRSRRQEQAASSRERHALLAQRVARLLAEAHIPTSEWVMVLAEIERRRARSA